MTTIGAGISGPAFADVATAADGDGSCISEQDLTAYFGDPEAWNDVPADYIQDGCMDEGEWSSLASDSYGYDGYGLSRKSRACCWHMRAGSNACRKHVGACYCRLHAQQHVQALCIPVSVTSTCCCVSLLRMELPL